MTIGGETGLRRAGFWRRILAFLVDMAVILVPLQIVVAVLFAQTNGRIQGNFGFTLNSCTALSQLPEGLQTQIANPTHATDCTKSFFGFPTARLLMVSRSTTEGAVTSTVSEGFWLDASGQLTDRAGYDVTWIAVLALVAFILAAEIQSGRSIGDRVTRIRVADMSRPAVQGLPVLKSFGRHLAKLVGFIPLAIVQAPILYYRHDSAAMSQYAESSIYRVGFYVGIALLIAWIVWIIVATARKRDPVYDRLAGTAVLRV